MAVDFAAWEQFAQEGAPLFGDAVVIERLLPDPRPTTRMIDEALRTATRRLHHDVRIKGYRQGILDYRLTNALVLTPCGGSSANEWLARVTDDRAACAGFSDLTAWNLDLAEWVQPLLKALLRNGEHDFLSGADIYTFISDAGWTPFGIHKDAEPSMILHLGPAPKEVWLWPKGTIDPAALPRNPSYAQLSFDFDRHLGAADHYLLQPGDFISIPRDMFHLFRNQGQSKFLGFSLYPTDLREVVTGAFWEVTGKDFGDEEAVTSATEVAARIDQSMRDLPSTSALKESMRRVLHHSELTRKTFGYASCPHSSALPSAPAPPDALLRWAYSDVLAATGLAGHTELIARGRSITFDRRLDFTELVRMAASDGAFTHDAVKKVLPADLSDRDGDELTGRLYSFGALVTSS